MYWVGVQLSMQRGVMLNQVVAYRFGALPACIQLAVEEDVLEEVMVAEGRELSRLKQYETIVK